MSDKKAGSKKKTNNPNSRYRKIEIKMWGDSKFQSLSPIQPSGQALWIYLLTGPHTGVIPGLFKAGRAAMAEDIGWEMEAFDKAFGEAFRQGMAKADWKARLVWLPNAILHNKPESPNVVIYWGREFDHLPECDLKNEAYESLKASIYALGEAYGKAFDKAFVKASAKPLVKAWGKGLPEDLCESGAVAGAVTVTVIKTPLPPKGGVGGWGDETADKKTAAEGADAPAASRGKSAGQEKGCNTAGIPVNGDLFHESQDLPQTASPAGNGLAGEPPGSAAPPVTAGRKKSKGAAVAALPIALPDWINPDDWAAFLAERARKKPMSAEAQRRAIVTLEKLRLDGEDIAAVINQSIVSGYLGFFPVNSNRGRAPAVPQSRQAVRDVLSGMHHDLDKKDYSAGVTVDGKWAD